MNTEEQIGKAFLDAAYKVHTALGPGLLESVYEAALEVELTKVDIRVERQKPIPLIYDGKVLDVAFRADLILNGKVLVELKSVEALTNTFKKTTLTYMKLIPLKLGYLINFNEAHLKNGVVRIVNGLDEPMMAKAAASIDFHNPSRPLRPSRDISL
jgi:GxxExxY protein